MGAFRGFKLPRHQKFEYRPRYWNPEKEDLENRLSEHSKMINKDPEALKSRISQGLRRGARGSAPSSGKFMSNSNLLLIGIIAILFILSYFILTVYLPDFIQMIEQ